MDIETLQGVLTATIRMSTPLLLASLGGLFAVKSGVINMALEGFMLVGAFWGYIGSVYTGSIYLGTMIGMLGGVLISMVLAFLSVHAKANQTVAGVGINILCLGLTNYLLAAFLRAGNRPYGVGKFSNLAVPALSEIPFIGTILFDHTMLTYAAFIMVPLVWYVLYRTPWGLKVRAIGENPKAVDTLGGNVIVTRYTCLAISGFLAGLGGVALSVGQTGQFMENITSGKGYIALATLIFGKYTPVGAMLAALLFGFADGLQLRLQTTGSAIPFQFLTMLPYVLTMLALILLCRKITAPASLGKPYSRQG